MTLIYFLQAFIIIYVSYLSGKLLCDHFKLTSECTPIKKMVYAIGIGYGILGNIALLLGLIELYTPASFIIIAIGVSTLSRKTILDHIKQLKEILSNSTLLLLEPIKKFYAHHGFIKAVITIWIILYFAISSSPSAMSPSDGLYYHLPFVIEFAQNTGISFPIRNDYSYGHLPLFTEVFYGIPVSIFHNFISFKIIQFITFLLLILLIGNFVWKHVKNRIFSWILIVLLFANMPLVKNALEGGMIDIFTVFFGLAALLAIIDAIIDKKETFQARKMFITMSLFIGLALSTKYIALFYLGICFMFLIFFYIRNKEEPKKILADFILYFLIIITLCGFWYIKNIIYLGNPVFPMFSNNGDNFTDAINSFVLDRTPLNFLIFPFYFFGKNGLFLPYALMTAATFVVMYGSMIFLFLKRRVSMIEILLLAFIETYLLLLFFTSHTVRFAIPVLIGSSILLVLTLDKITTYVRQTYPNITTFSTYTNMLLGFFALALLIASMWSTTLKQDTICLLGFKSSDTCFYEIAGANIYLTNHINASLRNETVLEYWNIFYFFHLKNGNYYSRFWCDGMNNSETELRLCLKTNNISYLVDDTKSSASYSTYPERDHMKEKMLLVEYFKKHGTIVYEFFDQRTNSTFLLYKLL